MLGVRVPGAGGLLPPAVSRSAGSSTSASSTPRLYWALAWPGGGGLLPPVAGSVQVRWVQLGREQQREVVLGAGVAGGGGLFVPVAGSVQVGGIELVCEQQREVVL